IETGRPKEAVMIGKKVQKILEQCDESELWRADNFLNMGAAYENMGLNQFSLECYENAIQVLKKQKGAAKITKAGIYNQIGSCTQNMQLYAKAHDAYRKALDILEKYSGYESELYGTVLNNMGQLMQETKHAGEALNYYGRALKCYQEYFPDENMHIANTLDNMGSVFDMREEYKKAAYFHLKGLRYRLINGGLYTPSTVTSLHNLANTWYLEEKFLPAYIAERMAVLGLKRQEISADDYPVYMCMGGIMEHIHLRRAAHSYYMQAYHLLNKKREIVSETAEIYLILATFTRDWEERPGSVKKLLKANMLLDNKKELYRKDYELKVAVYFSLEKYYCYHGRYKNAIGYLDAAEKLIDSKLDRTQYMEILETISEVRKEITDCMEG
ncbi:MAG: tetratricopeptide repeat protein, partial [Lachnospiraceae bacterium]|nr:tetratricopeptide repeat protein [Lachnospiraceae bacterium]